MTNRIDVDPAVRIRSLEEKLTRVEKILQESRALAGAKDVELLIKIIHLKDVAKVALYDRDRAYTAAAEAVEQYWGECVIDPPSLSEIIRRIIALKEKP